MSRSGQPQLVQDAPATNGGWESESRASTVGIIDVTAPACTLIGDPDPRPRGVGNPCIVSNIFRTRPVEGTPSVRPFAMLGVGDEDTRAFSSATSSYVQTNAFDPARVGTTNGTFWSLPVTSFVVSVPQAIATHWNCQITLFNGSCAGATSACTLGAPPQSPARHIWDGTNGLDPAFVGEYVSTGLTTAQNDVNDYVDWRIMPGSPMENLGVTPIPQSPVGFETAPHAGDASWRFSTWFPRELNLFAWDGEHWGNPRISDGAPDIGFDERGLVIAAGNWANDSNSHNQPGFMHPTGVGSATRYFILPRFVAGFDLASSNKYLRFHDTTIAPIAPNAGDGWVNPPGSLVSPTSLASLPVGYRTKYLSFATIPWAPISLSSLTTTWRPFGPASTQPVLTLLLASRFDDECDTTPCKHAYFNLQGVIMEDSSWPTATIEVLRGNMQAEYR